MSRNFCLDIGGSFIKLGIGSGSKLTPAGRIATPATVLDDFLASTVRLLLEGGLTEQDQLGISIAGSIDRTIGAVHAVQLPALADVSLAEAVAAALSQSGSRRSGGEIVLENDADCFALAEACFGAGRGHDNIFGIILGTGVGGAQVYRRELVRGFGGIAGEWGHGPFVQRQVPSTTGHVPQIACSCGQTGCINTIGGARGMEAIHSAINNEEIDSRKIVTGWSDGDPACSRTIAAFIGILSDALAVAINTTGADIVPVGGGLSGAQILIARLNEAVQSKILVRRRDAVLVKGETGEDGGLWGIHARLSGQAS